MNRAAKAREIPEELPTSAPPLCPFCRIRPAATHERDCPADDAVVCRCCPVCREVYCYARIREGEGKA